MTVGLESKQSYAFQINHYSFYMLRLYFKLFLKAFVILGDFNSLNFSYIYCINQFSETNQSNWPLPNFGIVNFLFFTLLIS